MSLILFVLNYRKIFRCRKLVFSFCFHNAINFDFVLTDVFLRHFNILWKNTSGDVEVWRRMCSTSPGLYATLNHFRLIFLLYTPWNGFSSSFWQKCCPFKVSTKVRQAFNAHLNFAFSSTTISNISLNFSYFKSIW